MLLQFIDIRCKDLWFKDIHQAFSSVGQLKKDNKHQSVGHSNLYDSIAQALVLNSLDNNLSLTITT